MTEETTFLAENWGSILSGLAATAEIAVRLTPSKKDNSIVNIIVRILDFIIPNKRRSGTRHNLKKVD